MTLILVVDDSMVDLQLAGGLLEKGIDCQVLFARDGVEALECGESELPNLVLTDMQMPQMDGLELVERMRSDFPLIPVVLMTAEGSEGIAVEALEKGAASYVPKREMAHDLVETISRLLVTSSEQRVQRRLQNYLTGVNYELANDLELLSALSSELRQTVRALRLFDDSRCLRLATAIDEALSNAFYHGNMEVSSELRDEDADAYHDLAEQRRRQQPYCDRRIHVMTRFNSEAVTIVVRDEGPGFDPDALPDPTEPGFLQRPHGRGLLLMRAFMDEVRFNDVGNEVTMTLRVQHNAEEDAVE
ncbi:MAG: ATP-binding protein [Planctomycetes bacterium]|nr:ATP-binding protein [Planctomycetota bacterium]